MTLLVVGLFVFLSAHSIRIFGEPMRAVLIARLGALGYKALYSLVSLVGLILLIKGYAMAREQPLALWTAWAPGRHVAALLSLVAFILVVAAYVPGNRLKARLRHPMVLGVKVWAAGHLLANHTLADAVLFGGLLVWAVLDFRAARARDRAAVALPPTTGDNQPMGVTALGKAGPATGRFQAKPLLADLLVLVVALAAYWAFAFHLHASWIGVRPFG